MPLQNSGAPSINGNTSTRIPPSAFAPIITSVSDNSWVSIVMAAICESHVEVGELLTFALGAPEGLSRARPNWRSRATSNRWDSTSQPSPRLFSTHIMACQRLAFQSISILEPWAQSTTIRLYFPQAASQQFIEPFSFHMVQHQFSTHDQLTAITASYITWEGFSGHFRCSA